MMRSRKYFRFSNNFSSSILYMSNSSLILAIRSGSPARHDRAVGVARDGFKHVLRVKGVNRFLCVYVRTVEPSGLTRQLCSGPVKDRQA